MSFIGGLLVGWGLTQAIALAHYCHNTYWDREDRIRMVVLLAAAAAGGALWWFS